MGRNATTLLSNLFTLFALLRKMAVLLVGQESSYFGLEDSNVPHTLHKAVRWRPSMFDKGMECTSNLLNVCREDTSHLWDTSGNAGEPQQPLLTFLLSVLEGAGVLMTGDMLHMMTNAICMWHSWTVHRPVSRCTSAHCLIHRNNPCSPGNLYTTIQTPSDKTKQKGQYHHIRAAGQAGTTNSVNS